MRAGPGGPAIDEVNAGPYIATLASMRAGPGGPAIGCFVTLNGALVSRLQ